MTETALKVNSHRFELYRAYSIFGQFVKSCQIFLKLNSKRQYQSSGKENESRCLAFPSSTKRKIRHFHVAVMQRRRRNVQNSVVHQQSFCFPNLLIFFAVFVAVVVIVAQASSLLGCWYLNCTDTSENKKQCKFKSIQLLMSHHQQHLCQKSLTRAALRQFSP